MIVNQNRKIDVLIKITLILFTFMASVPLLWLINNYRTSDVRSILQFQDGIFLELIKRTSFFSLTTWIISVLTSVTAGFAIAVLDVPFRRFLLFATLMTMLIPVTALAMPLYVMLDKIGLNDNLIGLILASSYFPFGTFLAYLYFSSAFHPDLIGMGRIDGLGDFGLYRRIGLPLARNLVLVIAFFVFLTTWTSNYLPRVLLTDPHTSILSVGAETFLGQGWSTTALLMVVPPLVLYLASQRTIARGIFSGSVKE